MIFNHLFFLFFSFSYFANSGHRRVLCSRCYCCPSAVAKPIEPKWDGLLQKSTRLLDIIIIRLSCSPSCCRPDYTALHYTTLHCTIYTAVITVSRPCRYIYIYRERDRQTDRDRDRQTETDRETDRQTLALCWRVKFPLYWQVFLLMQNHHTGELIDDLRKSRELHSVSAYRHGLSTQVHACGCSAE